jgi:ferrous iron transport protein B
VLFEAEAAETFTLLTAGGWTLLTAINLMLFSLIHNPCSTTLFTIYKETGSWKWTILSALLPITLGLLVCFVVAIVWSSVLALQ